jgi:hypothetical protein
MEEAGRRNLEREMGAGPRWKSRCRLVGKSCEEVFADRVTL